MSSDCNCCRFAATSRTRKICEGADATLSEANAIRARFGIPLLAGPTPRTLPETSDAPKRKTIAQKIQSGIIGNAKAVLHIDRASDDTINQRWEICSKCEHYKHWMCDLCGCIVSQKIKIASEECPIKKWLKEARNDKAVE